MTDAAQKDIAAELMARHGQTFAEEIGIRLDDKPAPLFQLLVASLLFSARISADIALSGTKALFDAGWTTPEKMQASTWKQRTDVLNKSGYARYDESTSRMIADTTDYLISDYSGDLRKLHEAAGSKPQGVIARLTEFKGIGEGGASIFLREVQAVWPAFCPYVDGKAKQGADALRLNTSEAEIRRYAGDDPKDIARFVAALVRTALAKDAEEIIKAAA